MRMRSGLKITGKTLKQKLSCIERAIADPFVDIKDVEVAIKYLRLYADVVSLRELEKKLSKLEAMKTNK